MVVQAETKHELVQQDLVQGEKQDASVVLLPNWTENSPSYLSHLQASLAGLTEEDKDDIHASLQEA